jgi:hypothetical protein
VKLMTIALLLSAVTIAEEVPKTWDDKALADWATPVAGLNIRPGHFSEREYYAAPVDNLRTYPVYDPEREPVGYWETLQKKTPEPLVEIRKPRSAADWVRDGQRVFEELDFQRSRSYAPELIAMARSRAEVKKSRATVLSDGTLFGLRWVVSAKGIALSLSGCALCHTRIMPDGSLLRGAPRNSAVRGLAVPLTARAENVLFPGDSSQMAAYRSFGAPWIQQDIHEALKTMQPTDLALLNSRPAGVFARFNGSPYYPSKVPDLIGVASRKYFDHTATHRQRGIGDLMRYAALVMTADSADFGPFKMFADHQRRVLYRYPDELLYALAKYLYSLEPPPNPNPLDERALAGEKIFSREGCPLCHTPPLYTSNKLTLAQGFTPPKEHFRMLDILDACVGTDPNLALKTRKGTGYYKPPSLKGVSYRGLYLHDGSVASLEEMFDPGRLSDDHVPSGFKGYKIEHRAIPGHEFGLRLSPEEKARLIAFLRTL